ncbi:lysozyme inhibitor LprI family protein [Saccharibacillus sacchari]|uniref:Lysozyme inhibitor LprI family protein n=1 Tax=Saccharibacillus sacchari TaxID=456493 RepID=A0ACC6P857_9BACL
MNKKLIFYRVAVLSVLLIAVCFIAVMFSDSRKDRDHIELLSSRNSALQQSLNQANEANRDLKVQIAESKHLGDYQGNDDFSAIMNDNPIDLDYQKERKTLQASSDATTMTWATFESDYLAKWQKQMDASLDELSRLLNEEGRADLEQSQKSWQSYRDDQSEFVMDQFIATRYFGSQGYVQFIAAQSRQTRNRTMQLMEYIFSLDREAIDFVADH